MKYAASLLLLFLLAQTAFAKTEYVKAIARPGDGVYSLLELYGLRDYPCNRDMFYKINKISPKKGLKANTIYLVPVMVYAYNGKSIRTSINISDRPQAERIQQYNELMLEINLRKADYRVSKVLWVPYHEIACPDAKIDPEASATSPTMNAAMPTGRSETIDESTLPIRGIYGIFGKGYERVPLIDNQLKGKVFYIVSGHGGPDPGAVGQLNRHSLCEDEYAYDVALRLTRRLLAHGATAYLIVRDKDDGIRSSEVLACDKDEVCWPDVEIPASQVERLRQRANTVNALFLKNEKQGVSHQRLVVIHVDSDKKNERLDTYFYHRMEDPASKQMADTFQSTFKEKYDEYRKGRGYSGTATDRDLHMLRETYPPAVFIELGNIKNRNDQARLIIEGNRQLLSDWMTLSLIRDAK